MRGVVAAGVQLAGLAAVAGAAFMVSVELGVAAVGVALVLIGVAVERG